MVALVNAKRVAAGKSLLGWINPSLYALADQFLENDITSGVNNCVGGGSVCCGQGFECAVGWDPVTGLGSVNFGKFEQAFMSLGAEPNEPTLAPSAVPGTYEVCVCWLHNIICFGSTVCLPFVFSAFLTFHLILGTPTLPPVVPPTATPTTSPTASPSEAPGWMYINTYTLTECGGVPAEIVGYRTGICEPLYGSGNVVVGYTKYFCGGCKLVLFCCVILAG